MPSDEQGQAKHLLPLIQEMLAIEETKEKAVLSQAASLVAQALEAEKSDIFLYEQQSQTLVAQGVSKTLLGRRQQAIGMDRLPLANGGRTVEVFQTGRSYRNGQVEDDPAELPGIKVGLGIRSVLVVPLIIAGERRGAIQLDSTQPHWFSEQDEHFLKGVAHWIGIVVHRAELLQQVAHSAAEQARRGTAEALVTVLAHDLHNYLTPLQVRLGLLKRRAKREQRAPDLADVASMETTLRRLEQLINDLMDTARLSQGLFTLSRQTCDLTPLVQSTATLLQTPNVPVMVQAPTEVIIYADPDRLRQALENVLANAVRHTPKGTIVQVHIEIQQEQNQVLLSVSDQGPGIAEEILPTLFEPFQAGTGSNGLGLGLYLAAQITQAHGGQLSVDRSYREGTRFLFSLPTAGEELGNL